MRDKFNPLTKFCGTLTVHSPGTLPSRKKFKILLTKFGSFAFVRNATQRTCKSKRAKFSNVLKGQKYYSIFDRLFFEIVRNANNI